MFNDACERHRRQRHGGELTARAATALHVDPNDVFVPMILPMLVAIGWLYFLGFMYGRMERKRIGIVELDISHGDSIQTSQEPEANRAHLRWFNTPIDLSTYGLPSDGTIACSNSIHGCTVCISGELS